MSFPDHEQLLDRAIQCALDAGEKILSVYQSDAFYVEMKSDDSPLTRADKWSHRVILEGLQSTKIPVLSEESGTISWKDRSKWDRFWLVDPLDGTREFIKRNGEFTVNIALIEQQRPVLGIIYTPVQDILYFAVRGLGSYKYENMSAGKESRRKNGWMELGTRLPLQGKYDGIRAVVSRSHLSEETEHFIRELEHEFGPIQHASAGSSLKLCLIAEGAADIYPRLGPTMEWDIASGDIIVTESGGTLTRTDGTPMVYNKEDLRNPWFIAKSSGFVEIEDRK